MKIKNRSLIPLVATAIVLFCTAFASASDSDEKKGWGVNDPYNKLYNSKELDKIKAKVIKVIEVTPMPGMSPATALEVREDKSSILVHLCPVWFAKPSDIGVKPGDTVSIRGSWAEINGQDVFLAAKLKKGESQEFKVRLTKDGTPFWTMTAEQIAREREQE
jgi:hypothetical protein